MGSTRDFLTATVADALAPSFKRPVEDIIYETLDRRQTPSRTDFKELRDGLNSVNAQNSGFGNGIKKLKEGLDDLEESFHDLETQLVDLDSSFKEQRADNLKLKDTLNLLMEKVLLL
jgi:chromosome segregation ATPase